MPSFERAEKIIVLNLPEWIRQYRVIKRHFRSLAAYRSLYHRFFPILFELVKFNHVYEEEHYNHQLGLISKYNHKVAICDSCREAALELSLQHVEDY